MNRRVEFLYLSEEDMKQAGVLDMSRCVEVIDEMFQIMGQGDYIMGGPRENDHGIMIWFPDKPLGPRMPVTGPDRRFMSLISYLGGRFHVCGNKWYGSNIENATLGLPRSILTITLNDPDTSAPLAYMSGNLVSAMRTGAVPGVAAKYLANENSEVVGIVGAGVINRACLMAIKATQKQIKKVKIYDLNAEKAEAFAEEMSTKLRIDVSPADSLQACIEGSDIVNVATSGHHKPKIENEWLKDGALLALTGAADLSDESYKSNRLVADNWKMHQAWLRDGLDHPKGIESILSWAPTGQLLNLIHTGEVDEKNISDLGQISLGQATVRKSREEKVIFVTGGLPIEDVAWSYEVYQHALEKNIGQKLTLWNEPHWA